MTERTVLLAVVALAVAPSIRFDRVNREPVRDKVVIEVQMKDVGGGQWRFEPSAILVHPGDTVRFVQADIVPHNVQFKGQPKGAKLGKAQMGPFLLTKGETYDLIIDDRFVPGVYQFVCTPHEMLGMKGTLEVIGPTTDGAPRPRPVTQGGRP